MSDLPDLSSPDADAADPFPEPVDDPLWKLEVVDYDRLREREVESWFTVANGRTGTRGSIEEGTAESSPATYVAGVYGRPPDSETEPELMLGPYWIYLAPRLLETHLSLDLGEILEHRRVLDFRQGILFRTWRQRLPSGVETRFRSARFASISDRAVAALEAEGRSSDGFPITLVGEIPLPSAPSLEHVAFSRHDGLLNVELVARKGGRAWFSIGTSEVDNRLERMTVVSRAGLGNEPEISTDEALTNARNEGIRVLRDRHRSAWEQLWRSADVAVEGDPQAQLSLRFALYHLISSGDPDSDLASIGARGLTGPAYQGHVFWDTEVFVLPFFLYTQPRVARNLLGYRYRTLPAARTRARNLGYRGALFAWESADDGEDCTPRVAVAPDGRVVPILTGLQEHHISADVGWAVWQYWEATRDEEFLLHYGAEILVETARFWASRADRDRDGRHHINHVIGPDEYHEDVNDNAFTNLLAKWNLERGLEIADLLNDIDPTRWQELLSRLGLHQSELADWGVVAQGLPSMFVPESTLYEQFAGFFQLEDIIAADLAPRPFAGDLLIGRERTRRSQLIKQADVLMLLHMLPNGLSRELVRANYRYYEPRTSHGSSLSPSIHSAVAASAGLYEEALTYFHMGAAVDLSDRMGNAALGVHLAAAGGLWQAAVMGFGGVRSQADCLRIDPRLPDSWSRLQFPLAWRGTNIKLAADRSRLEIDLDSAAMVALGDGRPRRLSSGRYRSELRGDRWSEAEEVKPPRSA
jgi:kojibiose phosphorylase